VTNGKNKAIASHPRIVGGVPSHDLLEEKISHWSEANGSARVTVAHLFNGIGSQNTGRVYGQIVTFIPIERRHAWGLFL
jgi:hypothetical protein